MHRSRLAAFIIDCRTTDVGAAAAFWSQALGREVKVPGQNPEHYRTLASAPSEPVLEVQAVTHESRVHLDIESDDIEAEVARLTQLGARAIAKVHTWTVMEAPTGQRFCVVRPQRGAEALGLRVWPSSAVLTFTPTPQHARIAQLLGPRSGKTQTWNAPGKPPDTSVSEWFGEKIAGGAWVRIATHGTVDGSAHGGEMTLGWNGSVYEMSWVDSYHTAGAIMFSQGAERADGVIAVTCSFAAGDETWRWRTEFHESVMRAFVIKPTGEESLAIETQWH